MAKPSGVTDCRSLKERLIVIFKRGFDIVCSGFGLLLMAPLLVLIMVLIKLSSTGPIFFRQTRVGLGQKPFRIHKFRTMVVGAEAHGLKITVDHDPRITPIGRVLRHTKLDELPQLIDVFIGTMSLVGPRPEVPNYVQYYPEALREIIFSLRPGITDWASLKMIDENKLLGKVSNPEQVYIEQILPEKLAYAVKYVKTRTMLLDIYLIVLTLIKIVIRK